MKSSYIWRTFSSTTVLLVSFFSSSHASQNIMFSSLNSVRRNCLKQLRPAALFITFSNDVGQERASSRVGFGLKDKRIVDIYIGSLLSNSLSKGAPYEKMVFLGRATVFRHYLSSQLVVPSVLCSKVDLCIVSSSLLTVRLEEKTHTMRLVLLWSINSLSSSFNSVTKHLK